MSWLVVRARTYGWRPAESWAHDGFTWWTHPDFGLEVPFPASLAPADVIAALVALGMEASARKRGSRFVRRSCSRPVVVDLVDEIFGVPA